MFKRLSLSSLLSWVVLMALALTTVYASGVPVNQGGASATSDISSQAREYAAPAQVAPQAPAAPAEMWVTHSDLDESGVITATVHLDTVGNDVYSISFTLNYSSTVASVESAVAGDLIESWPFPGINTTMPGMVTLSAGGAPINGEGEVLVVRFKMTSSPRLGTALTLTDCSLNAGIVDVHVTNGTLGLYYVYVPVVMRN